jgi:hypothetical protein
MSKYEKIFAVITLIFIAFITMRGMTTASASEAIGFFILLVVIPWSIYLIFRKKNKKK